MKGRPLSEEHKRKISQSRIGQVNNPKGNPNAYWKDNPPDNKLDKNPNWKGGIKHHSKGYIMIKKPEHPGTDIHGYIKRSRLVMENEIGRYLRSEEIVHHINGIKDDDRPENLELFSGQNGHIKQHHILRSE